MQKVLPDQSYTFVIPVSVPSGRTITSVSFLILDKDGETAQASSAGTVLFPNVSLVALAATNKLPFISSDDEPNFQGSSIYDVRYVVTFDNSTTLEGQFYYLVEPATGVLVGVTSFATLAEALLIESQFPDMEKFGAASRDQQIAALTAAYQDVCSLRLKYYGDEEQQRLTDWVERFSMDLKDLTQAQVLALPSRMLTALKRAQVWQADYRLGGSPEERERETGLIQKTVGDASATFRSTGTGPIKFNVCSKAMKFLQPYQAETRWRIARG